MTLPKPKEGPVDPQRLFKIIRRIFAENGRDFVPTYAAAGVCLLAIAATTAGLAWVMRDVIDEIFVRQRSDLIFAITGTVFAIFTIRSIALYFQAVLLARVNNDLVSRYQKRTFKKLLSLGVDFYNEARSAQLAAQLSTNIGSISGVMSLTLTSFARDVVSLIGLVAVMIIQDPIMSLVSFTVAPVLIIAVSVITKRTRNIVRDTVVLNSKVIGTMQETVQGITVVKAFTMEDQLSEKIGKTIDMNKQRANSLAQVAERIIPLSEFLAGVAIVAVIAYGGYRAIFEAQPPGAMFAFITALLLAYDPARRLASLRVAMERAIVNAEMIYEILDMPENQRDKPGAKDLQVSAGEVEFSGVTFGYSEDAPVVNDLSFTAPANKTTAIVGPSGAGKTTIIALLQRMYDVDAGRISIDGHDIAHVTKSSLRGQIAFVSQQPYLFEGSIKENIRYGRPDATDAEIEEAAKLANAHDFIVATPEGYDTPLGENGMSLSGGQRQRISIARALVRNAPILLLDEATSALDNESEKLVQAALDKMMRNRTTIVIAHRLSTIVNADQIIVMDNGEVVETGTHEQLKKQKGGLYARLNALGLSAGKTVEGADVDG
ncbi:MAG: ABC transporter ATP-binding protein [Pseudomonadota bacterium]